MEGFKALFCSSKFPQARERILRSSWAVRARTLKTVRHLCTRLWRMCCARIWTHL